MIIELFSLLLQKIINQSLIMKKLLFTILTITSAFSFQSLSQNDAGINLGLNVGTSLGGFYNSEEVTSGPGLNVQASAGYMFNNLYGARAVIGFNTFNTSSIASDVTNSSLTIRTSVEGVLRVSQLAGFGTDKFDLDFHAGFGIASHSNSSWKETRIEGGYEFSDPLFKGNDDMINIPIGLTPQYHLSEQLSLNLDLSYILLMKRDWDLDYSVKHEGVDGLFAISLGVIFRL